MTSKHLIAALTIGITLAVSAAPALAGGEPKNEPPFTRPASDRAPTVVVRHQTLTQVPRGEPKNELPFTRPVGVATVVAGSSSGSFNWTDASIGAVVGLGLALTLVGGIVLLRGGTRGTPRLAG